MLSSSLIIPLKNVNNTFFQQVASCTLDAGVKIYAGRVDSVHAEAYKILGSLGRANEVESGGGKLSLDFITAKHFDLIISLVLPYNLFRLQYIYNQFAKYIQLGYSSLLFFS